MAANVILVAAKYGPYILEGFKLLKEFGVFSSEASEMTDSISRINSQIVQINSRISELSIRIDQVDQELRGIIQQVEYQRVANAVLSTNSVFRRYLEIGDSEGIARLLPLSDREERDLRAKLDPSNDFFEDHYPAYFNLFLIHAQSKFVIDATAASGNTAFFLDKSRTFKETIERDFERCVDVVRRLEARKYIINFTQIYGPPPSDPRDPVGGETYRGMGYSYDGGETIEVSRFIVRSGMVDVVSRGNAEREAEARLQVERRISALVEQAARDACASYQDIVSAVTQ